MRRPSVSRVREIRTHGLKGGLRKRGRSAATAPEVYQIRFGRVLGQHEHGLVAMIAHGPDRTDSLLERGYRWTHHHFPHIIDCQPIDAEQFLEKAGFQISAQAELETWTIPVIALVAEVSP